MLIRDVKKKVTGHCFDVEIERIQCWTAEVQISYFEMGLICVKKLVEIRRYNSCLKSSRKVQIFYADSTLWIFHIGKIQHVNIS